MSTDPHGPQRTTITTPSDTEIRIERVFDAPRELLWQCYSDPDLLSRWLGPRRLEMRVEEFDFRVGGSYRYVHMDADGSEYVFFGEYREINPCESIAWTFNYVMDPQPPPSLDRTVFEPLSGDRTRMVSLSTFETREMRDGMIQAGMETGVVEGNERLDELLTDRSG